MEVGVLAVRYAKALYEYAKENAVEREMYELSKVILGTFVDNRQLLYAIEDPLLSAGEKLKLMMACAGMIDSSADNESEQEDGGKLQSVIRNYFRLLLSNKREGYLFSSMRYFQQTYRKENGIASAKITSAIPIDDRMREKIFEKASLVLNKKIELEQVVDEKIVGGFILDVDDYRIDASVVTQVNKIRRALLDKNRRIV